MTRTDPPHTGSEAETLLAFLDYHRATLRLKTDGPDAAQIDSMHAETRRPGTRCTPKLADRALDAR